MSDSTSAAVRKSWWTAFPRWLRSPKGLFTAILLILTAPAAHHAGWMLVIPSLLRSQKYRRHLGV
jgi:hypothetical protein